MLLFQDNEVFSYSEDFALLLCQLIFICLCYFPISQPSHFFFLFFLDHFIPAPNWTFLTWSLLPREEHQIPLIRFSRRRIGLYRHTGRNMIVKSSNSILKDALAIYNDKIWNSIACIRKTATVSLSLINYIRKFSFLLRH